MTPERLAGAEAPWITWTPDSDQPEAVTRAFAESGELDGQVAVWAAERDQATLEDSVLPILEEFGIEPVETAVAVAPADDQAAGQAETLTIAERFEAAGADTVLLVGSSAQGWPTILSTESTYRPNLRFLTVLAPTAFATNAATTDTSILEGSLSGGVFGPNQDRFDEPAMQECVQTLADAGIDTPSPDQFGDDRSNQPYQAAFQACPDVALLRAALEAAGENLNYGTFEAAFDGLEVAIPGDPDPSHLRPTARQRRRADAVLLRVGREHRGLRAAGRLTGEFAATIGVLYGVAGSIEFRRRQRRLPRGVEPRQRSARSRAPTRLSPGSAPVPRWPAARGSSPRKMYGGHRPFGYIYGGSGGGLKTASCIESTDDVWDGAVPFVIGTPMSMPNVFSAQAHAMRLLWDKFDDIVDAIEPGGSGDMYAGLTAEQRDALAEITRFGFPPRAWFDVERLARGYTGVWSVLADSLLRWDPAYFDDFWTVPGYLGYDAPASLAPARIQHKTTVAAPVFADEAKELGLPMPMAMPRGTSTGEIPVGLRLGDLPDGNILGATVHVASGAAAGALLTVTGIEGDVVLTGVSRPTSSRWRRRSWR